MAGKQNTYGPVALTATLTTNIAQGGNASALVYDVIKHILITNTSAVPATVSLWIGATGANAAGTQLFSEHVIPAHAEFPYYCSQRFTSTQFLVGGRDASSTCTIKVETEQFVV